MTSMPDSSAPIQESATGQTLAGALATVTSATTGADQRGEPACHSSLARFRRSAESLCLRSRLYRRSCRLLSTLYWASSRLLLALLMLFCTAVLLLRYWLLPDIANWQPRIEQELGKALGIPVRIGELRAEWMGLNPGVQLRQLTLLDQRGQPGLSLQQVDALVSWRSLWRGSLTLDLLQIESPVLQIRRLPSGQLSLAGLDLPGHSDSNSQPMDWLLNQNRIRIHNARIVWEDQQRGSPPLALDKVQFGLDNGHQHHRFALNAQPPAHWSAPIDLRGDLIGRNFDDLDEVSAWKGQLYLATQETDLAIWQQWVDYPWPVSAGRGNLRLWATLDGKGGVSLSSDLGLRAVAMQPRASDKPVQLDFLQGRLKLRQAPGLWHLAAERLALQAQDADKHPLKITETDLAVQWESRQPWALLGWIKDRLQSSGMGNTGAGSSTQLEGRATANQLDLAAWRRLANLFPLPAALREGLQHYAPQGVLQAPSLSWQSQDGTVQHYKLRSQFQGLGLQAVGKIPGFANLSGDLKADESGGKLTLESRNANLDLPELLAEPRIALQRLDARLDWKQQLGQGDEPALKTLEVTLKQGVVENSDAAGKGNGSYRYVAGQGLGKLDLEVRINRAETKGVWRYLPRVLKPEIRQWLRQALVQGKASEGSLRLQGRLEDFPYRKASEGIFDARFTAKDVRFDYAPGWPGIEHVDGDVRFSGPGMFITARQASISGAKISNAQVEIPDFDVADPILAITGKVQGAGNDFIRFLNTSPVGGMIGNLTAESTMQGEGQLALQLKLPLRHFERTEVRGDYRFLGNTVSLMPSLPEFGKVEGILHFNERGVEIPGLRAQVFGHPGSFAGGGRDGNFSFDLKGRANIREVGHYLNQPLFGFFGGNAAWAGRLKVNKAGLALDLESDLQGVNSSLPEPLNKAATTPLPLKVVVEPKPKGLAYRVTAGTLAEVLLEQQNSMQGKQAISRMVRGAIGIGEAARLPEKGLNLGITLHNASLMQWKPVLEVLLAEDESSNNASTAGNTDSLALSRFATRIGRLHLFGREFSDFQLSGRPDTPNRDGSGWFLNLDAPEVSGEVHWFSPNRGKPQLKANFRRFHLSGTPQLSAAPQASSMLSTLPDMDIQVADFSIDQRRFGRLEVKAKNQGTLWQLDKITIDNPDGHLSGKGNWRHQGELRTQLDFNLESSNVGGLLDRLGFPGTFRRGSARLGGQVSWQGAPTVLDYPSLNGSLHLEASKGQFAKIEPGLGKLVGLLSLQALPRHVTLDFNDIFSDGFAFDSIEAEMGIRNGILRPQEELHIEGPAASISMRGEVDLAKENQNLQVSVQPQVLGVAAMGAVALANPVAGVAAVVANKVFKNPINRLFSYRYQVTGSWADPKVSKQGSVLQAPVNHGSTDSLTPPTKSPD